MKKIQKLSMKSIALILSVIMILLSLPLQAFAEAMNSGEQDISTGLEEIGIIELTEERTASTKRFRLEDGSFYIAQYNTAVHYLDENEVWQEIDNTLDVTGNEISTANRKIKFAKKTGGSEKLFTLHDRNRKLSLSLVGANKKVDGIITNFSTEENTSKTELQKMTALSGLSASVKYRNILPRTDIEYIITGENVKEYITVKEMAEEYTYTFSLTLNNLVAFLNERGEVIISDTATGEIVYRIPVCVMWDAAGNVSDRVTLNLIDLGNGSYALTVTADADWMNAEERVYPVTIDPPLVNVSSSNISDVTVSSTSPNTAANGTILSVDSTSHSYWKYNSLPSLPASAYITEATFELTGCTDSAMDGHVGVYQVLNNWDSTLTWSKISNTASPEGSISDNYTDFTHISCTQDLGDDYNLIPGSVTWNVTPLVKEWYSGQNYGLAIAPVNDTQFTGTAKFYSNDYGLTPLRPTLTITYRDMKGLEDYWSFSSQSAGFAGSGSVNHATGKLSFAIPTVSSTDALMPVTPTIVYNSALAGKNYSYPDAMVSYNSSYMPVGFKLNLQETLLKYPYQTLENGQPVTTFYFIWSDGDGTEHYFLPSGTDGSGHSVYHDEDGLHLTLTEYASTCTIKDDSDTVWTFSPLPSSLSGSIQTTWCLTEITDESGNMVTLGFDSSYRPTSVSLYPYQSDSIEQLRILYGSGNRARVIWNPNTKEGVVIHYMIAPGNDSSVYDDEYVCHVIRAHGGDTVTDANWLNFWESLSLTGNNGITVDGVATYDYSSDGNLTSVTNNLSGYRIEYGYTADKVTSVKEYSTAGEETLGQQISFNYLATSTEVRTAGSDDVFGNSDDLITTYGFDGYGRTVSCYTTDLTRTTLHGASNGQYESDTAPNKLTASVQTVSQSPNYLLNGGFELGTLSNWNTSGSGISLTHDLYEYDDYHLDMVLNSAITSNTVFQHVMLDEGEYTLSFLVRSSAAADVTLTVTADSVDNAENSRSRTVSLNRENAVSGFALYSLSFPADYDYGEYFTIFFTASGAPSSEITLSIDDVMLSRTTGASEYDMLSAGHFEHIAVPPTRFWSTTSGASLPLVNVGGGFGTAVKVDTTPGNTLYPYQTIQVGTDIEKDEFAYDGNRNTFTPKSTYTLSAWGKGTAQSFGGTFGFTVTLKYYDGTADGIEQTFDFHFNKSVTEWQFLSGVFEDDPTLGVLDTVTVTVKYENNPGIGYFDNISLVSNSNRTSTYDYNDSGYLDSAKQGTNQTIYRYMSQDPSKISRIVSSNKTVTDYGYDDLMRVIRETYSVYTGTYGTSSFTPVTNTVVEYTLTDQGQVSTVTTMDMIDRENTIRVSTTYNNQSGNPHFGSIATETDARGESTQYFYHPTNGRLLAVIYPDGNGVSYSYDAVGNLIAVYPACASGTSYSQEIDSEQVFYTYDAAQRLSRINTASTAYHFTYDVFGNTDTISVGSRELVDYTYNANNGKLNTLTYGNGDKVQYIYDALDRISEVWYNNGVNGAMKLNYSYAYDSNNQIHSLTDHISDEVTVYDYDAQGRLIKSYTFDQSTYLNLSSVTLAYSEDDRLESVKQFLDYSTSSGAGNAETSYEYEYSETTGNLSKLSIGGNVFGGTITPTYDTLGRTHTRTADLTVNGSTAFYYKQQYTYAWSPRWYATGEISTLRSWVGNTESTATEEILHYAYDANGNITRISNDNATILYQYEYDNLGQLVREDNYDKGYSYTYTYDFAGNIQTKKTYAFSTGALGSVISTQNYTYGDSSWGDLLTGYWGNEIDYDTIGNPIVIGTRDSSDTYWNCGVELDWDGRQLKSYQYFLADENERYYENSFFYQYNADGIRTSKTVDGIEHKYYLNGSQILAETWKQGSTEHLVIFVYDENGSPIALKYRTNSYAENTFDFFFYEKNLQGDIIGIFNTNGRRVGWYIYDAWGACSTYVASSTSTLEQNVVRGYNPFRYRGYYYDVESSLYYLQSRYYNPAWGRFLNADGQLAGLGGDLRGYNLFAYCMNNPISLVDSTGYWPKWLDGTLNTVSGVLQMATGVALGAAVGWTGIGVVAAGILMANGAATATQGIGQIVNDVANTEVLSEENLIRSSVQSVGEAIGGETGATVAGYAYDGVVLAAGLYAGKVSIPQKTVPANPGNAFKPGVTGFQYGVNPNTLTPTKNLSNLDPQRITNAVRYGGNQSIIVGLTGKIYDGHHRVADAIRNGRAIDVFVQPFK